jgi:hypothetical protein
MSWEFTVGLLALREDDGNHQVENRDANETPLVGE